MSEISIIVVSFLKSMRLSWEWVLPVITGSTYSRRSPGYYLYEIPTRWVENRYKSLLLKRKAWEVNVSAFHSALCKHEDLVSSTSVHVFVWDSLKTDCTVSPDCSNVFPPLSVTVNSLPCISFYYSLTSIPNSTTSCLFP